MIVAWFFVVTAVPIRALAEEQKKGKLQQFEEQLDQPKQEQHDRGHDRDDDHHHHDVDHSDLNAGEVATQTLMQLFMTFLLSGLMTTGSESMPDLYRELKESWNPALPTVRVEGAYQRLAGGLNGVSGKIEAGYLTFGADFEYLRDFESNAPDLTFLSGHFLLRSLLARVIGANLALGVKSVFGQNKHTGFELGLPFYLFISRNFIFDILPYMSLVNGETIYDVAGGVSFKYKYVGVRAAYRAMFLNDDTLHGPQVGLFFQW